MSVPAMKKRLDSLESRPGGAEGRMVVAYIPDNGRDPRPEPKPGDNVVIYRPENWFVPGQPGIEIPEAERVFRPGDTRIVVERVSDQRLTLGEPEETPEPGGTVSLTQLSEPAVDEPDHMAEDSLKLSSQTATGLPEEPTASQPEPEEPKAARGTRKLSDLQKLMKQYGN
jgi:hypothetical protein